MLARENLQIPRNSIKNKLKILHVSTSDTSGGAARAAYRLHTSLLKRGYDSTMFVANQHSKDPSVKLFIGSSSPHIRARRMIRRLVIASQLFRYNLGKPPMFEIFTDDRSMYGASLLKKIPVSDVINLHWIATFIDYRPFFKHIPEHSKIVWTLHDMNPFTGGCHYDNGCGKFTAQCGSCPQLGSSKSRDLSRQIWLRKQVAYSQIGRDKLHIVTPSHWLAMEAQRSSLLGGYPITVIPNGVDVDSFVPIDQGFARTVLGIPEHSKVVLFVADYVTSQRKGFSLLMQAFETLKDIPDVFLLSVGHGVPAVEANLPRLHLGQLASDRLLSLAYSSADVFVIPSVQDNLPNTILESFACGTPVVGFSIGGIPDLVRPGETGDLAQPFDVKDLGGKISNLLTKRELCRRMGENCRQVAISKYSLGVQADKYIQLYRQITE